MKKTILVLMVTLFAISGFTYGQSTEVLYFKAKLACCRARACDRLEKNIQTIVKENFDDDKVSFRTIRIADPDNQALVDKYNAKSQTVVVVRERKIWKDKEVDISDIVSRYSRMRNKKAMEKEIIEKIQLIL